MYATVASVSGDCYLKRDGVVSRLQADDDILAGDLIRTWDGIVTLNFARGGSMEIGHAGRLNVPIALGPDDWLDAVWAEVRDWLVTANDFWLGDNPSDNFSREDRGWMGCIGAPEETIVSLINFDNQQCTEMDLTDVEGRILDAGYEITESPSGPTITEHQEIDGVDMLFTYDLDPSDFANLAVA